MRSPAPSSPSWPAPASKVWALVDPRRRTLDDLVFGLAVIDEIETGAGLWPYVR